MMKKTKLAHAVAVTMAGAALSLGAVSNASAHTMYNTYNAGANPGVGGTDGWVYGAINSTYPTVSPGWVGTASATTNPFGYTGASIANWAAELHSAGGSLTISRADAVAHYGVQADIDTARGAWQDASASPQGWAHNTDIGLFKAEETAYVTLTPSVVGGSGSERFGITVFSGMDTGTGYTHHTDWNSAGKPSNTSDPFDTTGVSYLTHNDNLNSTIGLTFLAKKDQVYSIYLGGVGGKFWNGQHEAYSLGITSRPVPVPAALWLFGSALAGMGVIGRRKQKATA